MVSGSAAGAAAASAQRRMPAATVLIMGGDCSGGAVFVTKEGAGNLTVGRLREALVANRRFLFGIVIGLVAAAVLTPPAALAAEARRPNFLFIVTDDQRWDAMGCVQKEQGE